MTTKKYKLLKDLPFAKAGTIITHNPNDEFICQEFSLHFSEYDLVQKYITNADWFEPIIKKPKQILKYANGAVMENLEVDQQYYSINSIMAHQELWEDHICDATRCMQRNIFLTRKEAQRAFNMQIVQNWLLKKIAEIDANNNWVADWFDEFQGKYSLYIDYERKSYGEKEFDCARNYLSQGTFMSEQAKNYMMSDEVSLEDFKLFLGVFNY